MIKITSHQNIGIKNVSPNDNVILITEPNSKVAMPQCKNLLVLRFEDIWCENSVFAAPTKDHIKQALDFAQDKDNLTIACTAGVSRSSAIACIIAAQKCLDPISVLNKKSHHPNNLIIKLGADLLKKPELYTLIERWKLDNSKKE